MEIKMKIDGKTKMVEIPFWWAMKLYVICYLAAMGLIFAAFFVLGFMIGISEVFMGL